MTQEGYLEELRSGAQMNFGDLIELIDENYNHTPASFINGDLQNTAIENQGSAKLFYFGVIHQLTQLEVLHCFGEHYQTVLNDPNGDSHQNIRNFIIYGWEGLKFDSPVLIETNNPKYPLQADSKQNFGTTLMRPIKKYGFMSMLKKILQVIIFIIIIIVGGRYGGYVLFPSETVNNTTNGNRNNINMSANNKGVINNTNEKHENIFYYNITVMNEIYTHPEIPAGTQEGIIKGIYPLKKVGTGDKQVQLLGSGTILREVEKAAQMLADDWGVKSNIWSVTSFNELTREAQAIF
ncbi:Pyruvate dehydrogenase E1 component (EC 1.2.4.1) [uncultured Gammaproteobacteria bacterium]|nr:Pyruvate dehydrogenase E1 component (EC 1.2.4.1) [uncultured Gammaproteobacteria bacterium]